MSTSTLTSKGQITIPKPVREALDLDAGTQVVFVIEGERALLYPVRRGSIDRLQRTVRKGASFTTRDAEREAARTGAVSDALGASSGTSGSVIG